jgi:hypothetical protein
VTEVKDERDDEDPQPETLPGPELEFAPGAADANQCLPALQLGNLGDTGTPPTSVDGIEFSVEPEMAVECTQAVQQSAAATSGG